MAVAKSLDKTILLYAEGTDQHGFFRKMTEKRCAFREIRVQKSSFPDFAIAMSI